MGFSAGHTRHRGGPGPVRCGQQRIAVGRSVVDAVCL